MMKERREANRILAVLLLFVLLLTVISGCGGNTPAGTQNGAENVSAENNQDTRQPAEGTAMGRYVENVTDLSNSFASYGSNNLYKLADGNLVISSTNSPFLISKDNGATWEEDSREWLSRMLENKTYIMSLSVGPDNTVGIIYHDDTAAKSPEENVQSEESKEDAADDEEFVLCPRLLIIKPDGSEISADITITEDDFYLYQVYIADNGRIFVTTMGSGNIYEVKEDGSSELFLTIEYGRPELMQFQGNLMIMDAYGCDGLLIYDMEKKEYIEDEVLDEFVNTNYKDRSLTAGVWYDMYFLPGEEGVLYLAGEKGLYRHVIGGSAMEQVIDGSLCSFNNPAYSVLGMLALENDEFIVLFTGGRLIHFVYDPDIPTVPTEKLKVYSLKENDTIRQAITLYQSANPAVFAEYEIGMEEGSSITREDALKSLNTRIMAGDGPDVLILDGMPLDSYIEKGLLLDLSAALNSLSSEDELFTNIVDAVKTEDKIYAMPCEIQLPLIMGEEKYVSKANNLKGIADAVEKLRQDNPGKDLLRICTEKGIMRMFAMTSVPGWIKESGDIDKEAITDFLTQTKRIYDAQMDGISDESIEDYNEKNERFMQAFGEAWEDSEYLRLSVDALYYVGNLSYMECGALSYAYGYANLTSVNKVEGFENTVWIPMNGQAGTVFCAQTLVGISAASKSISQAEDFIKVCLGKENQSYLFNGFAVNKAAFEESFAVKEEDLTEDGCYGSQSMSNAEGLYIIMDIYWPSKEQIDELRSCIEAADIFYMRDDVLEDAVYEEGTAYMQGTQSLDEAVSNIEKKVSIYMAE